MRTMKAAVVTKLKRVECQDVRMPESTRGLVLVKTTMASICGSDLHIAYMGWNVNKFPLPPGHPGHEAIGKVVDGGDTEFNNSQNVLTLPNVWKSRAFAEYQLIEPQYLLQTPNNVPTPHLLMAQQLGTVIYADSHLPPLEGKTVTVIGQGSAGLFHDFIVKNMGASRLIVIDPIPERLAIGKRFGADIAIDVTGEKAIDAVLDLTNGHGSDVVIEAVGSTDTVNQAIKLARPMGWITAFGLPTTAKKIPFDWDTFFRKCLHMQSVVGAQDEPGLPDFRKALKLIISGDIDVSPLITHKIHISKVQEAFDLASTKDQGAIKVSLTF